MSGAEPAIAAVAGALLALERKTFGQFMLSRPLVVAPLVAAILGEPQAGLAVGVPLELFFLGTASYGASTPDHETLAALFAGALAAGAVAAGGASPAVFALAVFLALPLAPIGRRLEARTERMNVGLMDRAEELLERGRLGRATRQGLAALLAVAVSGALAALLGAALGPQLAAMQTRLGPVGERGLTLAWALFLGVSAAVAVRTIRIPRGALLSAFSAVAVFVIYAIQRTLLPP